MPTPDLEGFTDAQATLREKFGRDVTFLTYQGPSYASGVALDPQTQQPYDPTILPTASAVASASVRALKIYTPVFGGTDVVPSPIGILEEGQAVLSIYPDHFNNANLNDAHEVEFLNERYKIESVDYDAIANEPAHRVLVKIRQVT